MLISVSKHKDDNNRPINTRVTVENVSVRGVEYIIAKQLMCYIRREQESFHVAFKHWEKVVITDSHAGNKKLSATTGYAWFSLVTEQQLTICAYSVIAAHAQIVRCCSVTNDNHACWQTANVVD